MNDYTISNLTSLKDSISTYLTFATVEDTFSATHLQEAAEQAENALQKVIDILKCNNNTPHPFN